MQILLNSTSQPRSFSGPLDIKIYAAKQKDKWTNFQRTCAGQVLNQISLIAGAWSQLSNLFNLNMDQESALVGLQNKIDQTRALLVYDSDIGRHIRELAETNDINAVKGALYPYTANIDHAIGNNFSVRQLLALIESQLVSSGPRHLAKGTLAKSLKAEGADFEERLESVLKHGNNTVMQAEEQLASAQEGLDMLLADGQASLDELQSKWGNRQAEMEKTEAERIKEAHRELNALQTTFTEHMKLETAVNLWSTRAEAHKSSYESIRTYAIGTGGFGALLIGLWLLFGLFGTATVFPDSAAHQIALFTAMSVVGFTGLVWAMRIVIRTMMTEHHLWVDASARSAMAHTYLALIKENAASDDDRAIVLASLFNPVTDGLIKDDAMPVVSPTGMAASAIMGKGGA